MTPKRNESRTIDPVDPSKVAAAKKALISSEEAETLAELFRLLSDPTRTRILYALLESSELCVGDLALTVDAPENSVSQALARLRSAGAVRSRREGRLIYYSLDRAHVRVLLELSMALPKSLLKAGLSRSRRAPRIR